MSEYYEQPQPDGGFEERRSNEDYRRTGSSWSSGLNYAASSFPVFLVFGILAWRCWAGARVTKKCLDVSSADDKPAIQRALLANNIVVGMAIGIAISALFPDALVGPYTKMLIGILMGGIASVAINSYSLLGDSCDEDNIIGQKITMYILLGISIGLILNGIMMQFIMFAPYATQMYFWLGIGSVGLIILGTFNLISNGKCDKDKIDGGAETIESAKTASIVEIVLGSLTVVIVGLLVRMQGT
jgi:hypothetical protein